MSAVARAAYLTISIISSSSFTRRRPSLSACAARDASDTPPRALDAAFDSACRRISSRIDRRAPSSGAPRATRSARRTSARAAAARTNDPSVRVVVSVARRRLRRERTNARANESKKTCNFS